MLACSEPLGTPGMIIIAILVLILFGAKKLPTFARSLGRSMGEFRRAKEEFERELQRSRDVELQEPPDDPEPLNRTFRPRHAMSGPNVLVLLMLVISATLLVIGLLRSLGH